jgi:trehalose utilization protein
MHLEEVDDAAVDHIMERMLGGMGRILLHSSLDLNLQKG